MNLIIYFFPQTVIGNLLFILIRLIIIKIEHTKFVCYDFNQENNIYLGGNKPMKMQICFYSTA